MLPQHFHFLKIPKTDVIYVLRRPTGVCVEVGGGGRGGGGDQKSIVQGVPIALCCLDTPLIMANVGCVSGPKMINQYFNVYALSRVRTAGYATGVFHPGTNVVKSLS